MPKNYFLYLLIFCFSASYSQFTKARISSAVGLSYITGSIQSGLPRDIKKLSQELKLGNSYEFEFGYDINDAWGVGVYISNFHSQAENQVDGGFFNSNWQGIQVDTNSDITIKYYAPKLYFLMTEDSHKHMLISGITAGLLTYRKHTNAISFQEEIKASTVGFGLNLEYEYQVNSFLYLISRFTANVAFLSELKVEDNAGKREFTVDEFTNGNKNIENISNVGLSFGIRVHIIKPTLDNKSLEDI